MSLKSVIRPWFGLLALQPLILIWCALYGMSYWENMGPFSLITTAYLMPVYHYYEKWYPKSLSISDNQEDT